jgi:DNA-binding MarR family transcriptional regulator
VPVAARDVSDEELVRHWKDIESATARLHRQLDADLEAAGVPAQWFPALELLLSAEGHRLPMSTLARELTMTSGGFSKLADRMAADGLIDRRGTTDDRRVVHATLTEAGHELASTARAAFVRALRSRVDGTDPDGLAASAAALRRLAEGAAAGLSEGEPSDGSGPDSGKGADETSTPEPFSPHVARERDPALPDRRGRGHVSGTESQSTGPPRSGPDAPR